MMLANQVITAVLAKVTSIQGNEEGQGMAEYALILALVAILCIGVFTALSGGIGTELTKVTSNL